MTYVLQTHYWFLFNGLINSLDYCLTSTGKGLVNKDFEPGGQFYIPKPKVSTGAEERRDNFHIISASKSKYETKNS